MSWIFSSTLIVVVAKLAKLYWRLRIWAEWNGLLASPALSPDRHPTVALNDLGCRVQVSIYQIGLGCRIWAEPIPFQNQEGLFGWSRGSCWNGVGFMTNYNTRNIVRLAPVLLRLSNPEILRIEETCTELANCNWQLSRCTPISRTKMAHIGQLIILSHALGMIQVRAKTIDLLL